MKQRPPTPYAAKFSTPFCIAVGFLYRDAGLAHFDEEQIQDPHVLGLAGKVRYVVDPKNEYPQKFTAIFASRSVMTRSVSTGSHVCAEARKRRCPMWSSSVNSEATPRMGSGPSNCRIGSSASRTDLQAAFTRSAARVSNMTNELAGRVAIVTGGARNIGRAISLTLADAGAAVIVNALQSTEAAEEVAAEIRAKGGQAAAILADVSEPLSARALIGAAQYRFHKIDILVNNASVRRETDFADLDYPEWREILATTLDGAYLCASAARRYLVASGAGTIVNIGGLSSHTGAARRAHVIAAKAGLVGLTRALGVRLCTPRRDRELRGARGHRHGEGGSGGRRITRGTCRRSPQGKARRGRGAGEISLRPWCPLHHRQTIHVNGGAFM
jgi:3-oxoacyl-[acyl-carrier protein] reductase